MKFSREQILGAPSYMQTAKTVNALMPEYGEHVTPDVVIEAYIQKQSKFIGTAYKHADVIRKAFRTNANVKMTDTVNWDCQLATLTIYCIHSVIYKRNIYDRTVDGSIMNAKCALAICRYLPDIIDDVTKNIPPLRDFVEYFCCDSATKRTNQKGIDADLRKKALNLMHDAQKRLDSTVEIIQDRFEEIEN